MVKMATGQKKAKVGEAKLYARFSEVLGLYVNLTMRGDKVSSVSLSEGPPAAPFLKDHIYLTRIIDHIATGKDTLLDIPLDHCGTPFEKGVLEQLRKIPPGEVATYGEIAKRMGKAKASRAVGSACAKNPFTILVPCHRVVPSSGGVGNYTSAGGVEAKVRLLEREGAISKAKARGKK
jgi:O-6-methylguanine DNA methyltransferase